MCIVVSRTMEWSSYIHYFTSGLVVGIATYINPISLPIGIATTIAGVTIQAIVQSIGKAPPIELKDSLQTPKSAFSRVIISTIGPLIEEFTFREVFHWYLRLYLNCNLWSTGLLTASGWTIGHIDNGKSQLTRKFYLMFLLHGLLLTVIRERYGLAATIIGHVIQNTIYTFISTPGMRDAIQRKIVELEAESTGTIVTTNADTQPSQ